METRTIQTPSPLAYIAPPGSGLGFAMAGVHIEPCQDGDSLLKILRRFKEEGRFRIIFVDEGLAQNVLLEVEKINEDTLPAVVLLPNATKPLNVAKEKMNNLMIKAIGSDIFES
jgi:V/A-type H+/Na+-transporting ATPase subunit F